MRIILECVNKADNVRHSHVTKVLRNTKSSTSGKKIISGAAKMNKAKCGKKKTVTSHRFLVLFACFIFSRNPVIFKITQENLDFATLWNTHPLAS